LLPVCTPWQKVAALNSRAWLVLPRSLKLLVPPTVLTGKETHPCRWTNPADKNLSALVGGVFVATEMSKSACRRFALDALRLLHDPNSLTDPVNFDPPASAATPFSS
jgi:hypothetical protein